MGGGPWQSRYHIYVHLTPPTPLTMAWTRTSGGGRPHSKRHVVWRTGHRVERQRSSPTSLQRRLQAGYEGPQMDYTNRESLADNSVAWKQELSSSLKKRNSPWKKPLKKNAGKGKSPRHQMHIQLMCFTCQCCNRHCKSRIGLYNHTRRCTSVDWMGATSIVWHDWCMPLRWY